MKFSVRTLHDATARTPPAPLECVRAFLGSALMWLIGTMTWVGCTICPLPDDAHQHAHRRRQRLMGLTGPKQHPLDPDLGHPPEASGLCTRAQGLPI